MFGLFKKAAPDEAKVNAFCDWFAANHERIIASVENSQNDRETMFEVLDEVEAQLALVYRDGYQGDIQFEYGFNTKIGKWDLNLFHLNHKFLIAATTAIAERINCEHGDRWSANTAR